ncbi:hypothetical protein Scep_024445 [Stephania cephalantha]|uniref:Uncharacterized protein n=1 Tax=Stephania cephalantha TaxID=152367 RepID=A0AAP0EZB5_9MAGN
MRCQLSNKGETPGGRHVAAASAMMVNIVGEQWPLKYARKILCNGSKMNTTNEVLFNNVLKYASVGMRCHMNKTHSFNR